MKKPVSVLLALVIAFLTAVTPATAAPSPTASDVSVLVDAVIVRNEQGTVTGLNLEIIINANIQIKNLVSGWIRNSRSAVSETADGFVDVDGNLVLSDNGTPLSAANADPELLAAFEFAPSSTILSDLQKNGKTSVDFEVQEVKSGDVIKVLRLNASGEWDIIDPKSVADGVVAVEFTSLDSTTPIVITRIPAEVAQVAGLQPVAESNTGNYFILAAIILVAAAAIVGVCVFGKKKTKVTK